MVNIYFWQLPISGTATALSQLISKRGLAAVNGGLKNSSYQSINMSYLTDSYIVFTLKMKFVSKTTIFGLKMMVKGGLEKIFLKFLHAETISFYVIHFTY